MKINRHQSRFTIGEYSKAALSRVDEEKPVVAAEIQQNVIPSLSGKGKVRSGTEYLAATRSNAQARLIPFIKDSSTYALLELTAGKLRVMVDDEIVTRPSVATELTNGNFDEAGGWTTSASDGASAAIQAGANSDQLVMHANAQGSQAYAVQSFTVDSADYNKIHGLRINVDRGPVILRLGTTSGGQQVFSEQFLLEGVHSLAFTPTAALGATYYVWLGTRFERECVVNSVAIEGEGDLELDAPWTAAQLREISFDQSIDVVYFAHESWQPRQLERRGRTSWSLVKFFAQGGPVERIANGTRISFSGTRNNVTVTADQDTFAPNMIGTVVRAYHDRFNADFAIAAEDEWTETWVVRGIRGSKANDRDFRYQVTGSWSATGHMQRSISGESGDYLDHPRENGTSTSSFTGNLSVHHLGFTEDANLVAYHRIGIKSGNYTSGVMRVAVQYDGHGGYGWGRITKYHNPRSVEIEVIDKFNASNRVDSWDLGSWGALVSWPSCVALNDNRLWFGGRSSVWASALNDFTNFDDLDTTDLATFSRSLGSGGSSSSARWFLPMQRMIVGTEGSQVSIRAGAFGETLTSLNVSFKDCATIGANYVSPVKLDSRGIFVHSSGADLYVLKPGAVDYEAERLTVYNEEICDLGILELAAQREPETHVWAVRSDGEVPVIMYEFSGDQDTKTWWRFVTAGDVESVAVLPGVSEDRVYMVVNRSPDPASGADTGAEELAPNGVDVMAADFTDRSVLVVDSGTPGNDLDSDDQVDAWGYPQGLETLISSSTSTLKLTLQASGLLAYQHHNLAPASSDFTVSNWTKVGATTIGNAGGDLIAAPDGTITMQSIVPAASSSTSDRGIETSLAHVGGSGNFRDRVEVSFYAYYVAGEAFTDVNVYAFPDSETAPTSGDYAFARFELDNVLLGNSGASGTYALLDTPYIESLGDGFYRCRVRFLLGSADAKVRLYPSPGTPNGILPMRLWGLEIARLPTAGQQAGGYSQLVQHASNGPRILLPYQWDINGAIEGIRSETATTNLLPSGEDFSGYTADGVTINHTGVDTAPTQFPTATQLVETGSGVSRHGITKSIAGPNGQYVGSIWVLRSSQGWTSIRLRDPSGASYLANFNTTSGELALVSNDGLTNVESGVDAFGFSWWRIWVTATLAPNSPAAMTSTGTSSAAFVDGRWKMTSTGTSTASFSAPPAAEGAVSASGVASASFGGATASEDTNMLTNGDFETGDLTGWAEVGGAYFVTSGGLPGAYEGTYYAAIFSSTFSNINQQNVDLLTGFTADQISSGSSQVRIKAAYTKRTSSSQTLFLTFRFFDASFVQISTETVISDSGTTQNVYSFFSDTRSVPSNARYFSIFLSSSPSIYAAAWDSVAVEAIPPSDPALTAAGAASASFAGGMTAVSTMTAAGAADVEWGQYLLNVSGTATASFSAGNIAIVSAMTASGEAEFAPINPDKIVVDLAAAGSASVSWGSDVQEGVASFSIWLANEDEPDLDVTNAPVYTQTSGLSGLIWGAQVEYGRSRPSTYVPKEILASRPADDHQFDQGDIPWDDAAVTLFAEFKRNNPQAGQLLSVANGSDAHILQLDSSAAPTYDILSGGADTADLTGSAATYNTTMRLASSAATDDASLVVDGGSAATDSSISMPTISSGTVLIGSGFDGVISRIMILPDTSTEAELQAYGVEVTPTTYRYIEKLALSSEGVGGAINKMADSGALFAGPASSVTCAWLPERDDIVAWATNASGVQVPLSGLTSDASGVIELGDTYTNIWIGLGYQARYKSAKLAFANQGGTALLQRKRVAELGLLLENTHRDAVRFGEDFDRMRQMNIVKSGAVQSAGTVYSTYDEKSFSFPGSWDTDSRLCLEVNAPYPATFLGLIIGLEWNERGLG